METLSPWRTTQVGHENGIHLNLWSLEIHLDHRFKYVPLGQHVRSVPLFNKTLNQVHGKLSLWSSNKRQNHKPQMILKNGYEYICEYIFFDHNVIAADKSHFSECTIAVYSAFLWLINFVFAEHLVVSCVFVCRSPKCSNVACSQERSVGKWRPGLRQFGLWQGHLTYIGRPTAWQLRWPRSWELGNGKWRRLRHM